MEVAHFVPVKMPSTPLAVIFSECVIILTYEFDVTNGLSVY